MIKFLLFVICIKLGYSYPEGAPDIVCDSMMPNHDVPPQQCQSKYIIQSDKSEYNINETIRSNNKNIIFIYFSYYLVTVRGSTNNDYFKGIILIAKNEYNQKIMGTWSIINPSIKTISCDGKENTAITHSSPIDKLQIEALWHTPSIKSKRNIIIK